MFGKDNKEKKTVPSSQDQKREMPAAQHELKAVHFGEMSPGLQSIILSYIPTSQLQTAPSNAPVNLAWQERFKLHYPTAFLKFEEKNSISLERDVDFRKVDVDWKARFENEFKKFNHKDSPNKIVKLFLAIKDHDEDAIDQIFTEGSPAERLELVGLLEENSYRITFNENQEKVVPENQVVLDLLYKNIYNIYSAQSDNGLIDTSKVDSNKRTILYWAITYSQSPEIVQSLIAQGSRVDEVYPASEGGGLSCGPIHLASFLGRIELLSVLIGEAKEEESLVNVLDGFHMTPLMWAARGGAMNSIAYLIGEGADLHQRCSDGCNALINALSRGHDQAAVKLLEAGVSFTNLYPYPQQHPIHLACRKGCLEAVKLILSYAGAASGLLEVKDLSGDTPLFHAATGGQIEIIKYLLAQKKQELDKKSFESKDEKAVDQEKRQLFQNMLNTANAYNNTALSVASLHVQDEVVRLLVNEGAAIPAKLTSESELTPATQALLKQKKIEQRTARFIEERTKDPRTFIITGSYFGGLITTAQSHKKREIAAAEALSELQTVRRELKAAEATYQIIHQEYKSIEKQKSGEDRGLRHEHELADLKKEKGTELMRAKEELKAARLKLKEAENRVDACKVPIDKSTELDEIREALLRIHK